MTHTRGWAIRTCSKTYREHGNYTKCHQSGQTCPRNRRFIRTVKERARAIVNTLPFKQYPDRLIVKMQYSGSTVFHTKVAYTQYSAHVQ